MSNRDNLLESQQTLNRIARGDSRDRIETSVVTSPGARVTAWAVIIKSNSSHNVYNVRIVEIGDPGSLPTEIGGQIKAVNLAESFLLTGGLPAGTYAVISRVGERNVFYIAV